MTRSHEAQLAGDGLRSRTDAQPPRSDLSLPRLGGACRGVLSSWFTGLALGLGLTMLASMPSVAGEQGDRAIAAVRQLQARGEVRPGATLRLRVKQGNMVSFLGRDFQLQRDWERLTGVPIDVSAMPQLDSLDFIRNNSDADLTIARTHEFPDLDEAGLILPLQPLLQRFGFSLPDDPESGYMLRPQQTQHGGRVVAIPADLDTAMLFLRKDLLEDPDQRERFRARHQRELAPPRTWTEYQQLVEFFHRPAEGLYGTSEQREPLTAWMCWLPRFLSAAPGQALFDERMRPLLNGPAGIEATRLYAATVPFSPPQVLEDGKDYSYTLPFFVGGKAFATILTSATAKIARRETSAIRERFMAVPMPGTMVHGQLVRRSVLIYGNNLVVPRNSSQPLLAFLFAMWLTDPDQSLRSVTANGIADPYRFHHLRDEQVQALYTPQVLEVLRGELGIVSRGVTGLPGEAQYTAALNRHLWLAAAGRLSPAEAMRLTAREWDAITDRIGRSAQIERWQALRRLSGAGRP